MMQINSSLYEDYNRCKNMNKCDANLYLSEKISHFLNQKNDIYCSILAENIISNNGMINEEELNENPFAGLLSRGIGRLTSKVGGKLTARGSSKGLGKLSAKLGKTLTKKGNKIIARNTKHLSHINYAKGMQKAGLPSKITNKMSNKAAAQANKFYQQAINDITKQTAGKKLTQKEFEKLVAKRYKQILKNEIKANPNNKVLQEIAEKSGKSTKKAVQNATSNSGGKGSSFAGTTAGATASQGLSTKSKALLGAVGVGAAATAVAKYNDDRIMGGNSSTNDIYSKEFGANYQGVNEKDYRVN